MYFLILYYEYIVKPGILIFLDFIDSNTTTKLKFHEYVSQYICIYKYWLQQGFTNLQIHENIIFAQTTTIRIHEFKLLHSTMASMASILADIIFIRSTYLECRRFWINVRLY